VLLKSYFDESFDDKRLCVAGYSFIPTNASALDREWRKRLIPFDQAYTISSESARRRRRLSRYRRHAERPPSGLALEVRSPAVAPAFHGRLP